MKMTMQCLGRTKEVEIDVIEYTSKNCFKETINLGKLNKTKVDEKITKLNKTNKVQHVEIKRLGEQVKDIIKSKTHIDPNTSVEINDMIRVMNKREGIFKYNSKALDKLTECAGNDYKLTTDEEELHLHLIPMLDDYSISLVSIRPLIYQNMNKKLYPSGTGIRVIFNQLELEFPRVRAREVELYCALIGKPRKETGIKEWVESSYYNENVVYKALKECFGEDSEYESILFYSHNIYKEVTEFVAEIGEFNPIGCNGNRLTCVTSKDKDIFKLPKHIDIRCEIKGYSFDITVGLVRVEDMNNYKK